MIPLDVRLRNFLDSVSFLADDRRQRAIWAAGNPDGLFPMSLGEIYAQFFDDNDIDNFIQDELDAAPLTLQQRVAIRSFRDALNAFSKAPYKPGAGESDANLLDDPEWKRLIQLARSTLVLFQDHLASN